MRLVIIVLYLIFTNLSAEEISGIPKIVDGDTIRISIYKIRLEGIDAPEIRQICKKNNREYFCGRISKEKLDDKVKGNNIICKTHSRDRYKRYLATCYINGLNLNQWMVRNGHALAYRRYSKKYITDEDFAKDNKLGLWQGNFIDPEKWRKLN